MREFLSGAESIVVTAVTAVTACDRDASWESGERKREVSEIDHTLYH